MLGFHIKTAYLFVRSDIKTILLPVSGFAFTVSEDLSTTRGILVPIWVLAHLFLFDIDNQSLSIDEDKLNKPWRPLPSARISVPTAKLLSKLFNAVCVILSWFIGGPELMLPSAIFCVLVYIYDHSLFASHYVWKNVINGFGYATLEIGATTVLTGSLPLQERMIWAFLMSWAVICTTVHIQDLGDIEGDMKMGRRTTVIYYGQNITRASISLWIVIWSFILPALWGAGGLLSLMSGLVGSFLGLRVLLFRKKLSDERSFRIYNVWVMLVHLLAMVSRTAKFQFTPGVDSGNITRNIGI